MADGGQALGRLPEMMALQQWLDGYVHAWRTYDPARIGALFTADAVYIPHPYDTPIRGRQAIVDAWLEDRDDPKSWECEYQALGTTGDVGIAMGWTRYQAIGASVREYRNIFVVRFAPDGCCKEFTDWFVSPPAS